MKRHALALAASATAASLATSAGAQVATKLLLENTDSVNGELVTTITRVTGNGVGGFATNIRTTPGTDYFYGTATGATPGVLLSESSVTGVTAFNAFFGIDQSGNLAYTATTASTTNAYLNTTAIGTPGDALTAPGLTSNFLGTVNSISLNRAGTPLAFVNTRTTSGGTDSNQAILTGTSLNSAPLKSGDTPSGLPAALKTGTAANAAFSFESVLSPNSANSLVTGLLSGATTSTDDVIIRNGAGYTIGGTLVRAGNSATTAGGNGAENYENFSTLAISNAGDTLVAGDTTAATTADAFVLLNGSFLLREGQTVSGYTLTGNPTYALLNETSAFAILWNDALILGDINTRYARVAFKPGDGIDLTGDGVADTTLSGIQGSRSLAFSDAGANGLVSVQFIGRTAANGTNDLLLSLTTTVPEPASVSLLALGAAGLLARRRRA